MARPAFGFIPSSPAAIEPTKNGPSVCLALQPHIYLLEAHPARLTGRGPESSTPIILRSHSHTRAASRRRDERTCAPASAQTPASDDPQEHSPFVLRRPHAYGEASVSTALGARSECRPRQASHSIVRDDRMCLNAVVRLRAIRCTPLLPAVGRLRQRAALAIAALVAAFSRLIRPWSRRPGSFGRRDATGSRARRPG